jgi:GT2 family glycosyltransferase
MNTVVVILNWNGVNHLQTYLPSVVTFSNTPIYVIDNGSSDNSVNWINEHYPEIGIVRLEENLGFAGGYNAGLQKIDADRYVLLNSDVRVRSGWIEAVNKSMLQNDWSICSPVLLDDKNNEYYEYAGAAGGYIDKDGYMFCAGRLFHSIEKTNLNYNKDTEVFWASGAALFVDAKAWDEVDGFDADFFAHMEEIDLCWRLKTRGYKVGVCGTSTVQHLGGGTLTASNPLKVYLNFRNNLFILLKNQVGFPVLFITKRLLLDGVAALRFLLKGEIKFFGAVVKAHWTFFSMIPNALAKRGAEVLARNKSTPNNSGRYKKSILTQYFIKNHTKFSDLTKQDFEE